MCLVVQYTCQNCKKETGQRDYLRHTDGQRFAIPDQNMEIISFCPDIRTQRVIIQNPLIQSPGFPCMNTLCSGVKVKFNIVKYEKQEARCLAQLRDSEYKVALEGDGYTEVCKMLKGRGINKKDMQKLPGAKLEKWTVCAEEKLKEMTEMEDSYEEIKTALKAITGLNYTTYQIITKVASFHLYKSLFGAVPARSARLSRKKGSRY